MEVYQYVYGKIVQVYLGYQVSLVFSIGAEVNPLNLKLLAKVQDYFEGVGSISKSDVLLWSLFN